MNRAKQLLLQVTFPLWLPFFLPLAALGHYVLKGRLLIRQMRAAGRYLSPSEIAARIQSVPGTIIVDSAAFNHNRTHLWWTPYDVMTLAPSKPPKNYLDDAACENEQKAKGIDSRVSDFDYWVYDHYLDPGSGTAFLLNVKVEKWMTLAQVKSKYPNCKVVRSASGWLDAARHYGLK